MTFWARVLPIIGWGRDYRRADLRSDLAAGLTVGAMLVPQAMAYALLAGLPPEVGLYAATIPVLVYALFGTSRQLAVGPVAIVSLLTATALGQVVDEGTAGYLEAAAMLALLVGAVHLVLGIGRLGFLVNFLSHSVLVGFTAAAAIIIGFSQVKHLLGISVARGDHFYETVGEVLSGIGGTHGVTLAVGGIALAALFALKRIMPRLPAALVVMTGSIVAVELLGLEARGVATVGNIPDSLPAFGLPSVDGSLLGRLLPTAMIITLVGFMESIAVAKVYARRHGYEVEPNSELIGLGASNVAAGLFGGYPVTGGFSRTAVNDTAGARTPLASIVTALIVLATIAFLTPLLSSLPNAVLGAIIVVAVVGLVDVAEMRHIARVKSTDLVSLTVAFVATLVLGIELGIAVAVVASMLVVFARMSKPHTAVLGKIAGTTNYRNIERFPEARTVDGVRMIRIDAALSFVNATAVKKLIIEHAEAIAPGALVVDASGVNDLDATGVAMLEELLPELERRDVDLHLADVKGPVRDVLHRAGLWEYARGRIHATTSDAVDVILGGRPAPADQRRNGIDERGVPSAPPFPDGVPEHRPSFAVLACSDARVPPSVVFDQPAGRMFVVRMAGNTASAGALASLDYAVGVLGVGKVVVLGHTDCGAVAAAAAGTCDGNLQPIVGPICELARSHPGVDRGRLVELNVAQTIRAMRDHDGPTGAAIRDGTLDVTGAVFDLESATIRPLDPTDRPTDSPTDQPIDHRQLERT